MKQIKFLFTYSHTLLISTCFVALIVLAGAYDPGDPAIEKGPYEFNYPANFGNRISIPADNPTTKEGVYLGRMLFYEPLLSATNKVSCATCHKQQLAFTDGKAFSQGIDNSLTRRSAMSLANLLWMKKFFWDGRAASLEEQATVPITNPHEMGESLTAISKKLKQVKPYPSLFRTVYGNDSVTGVQIIKSITQFERTLISCNSKYDQYLKGDYKPTTNELNGMNLFMTIPDPERNIRGATCGRCHGTPKTFIELMHNNGLDSIPVDKGREEITGQPGDRGRFRVPPLRNVALTAPYMHDGRFKTLEEVLDHYNEHLAKTASLSPLLNNVSNDKDGKNLALTMQEQKNIISFLKMLTDSTFINDKRFSDPHNKITQSTLN